MIYIVEPKHEGHHISLYAKAYIEALQVKNQPITLLTSTTAIGSASLVDLIKEFPDLEISAIPDLFQNKLNNITIFQQFLLWFRLKFFFKFRKEKAPKLLIFPTVDSVFIPISLLGNPASFCQWVGVYMSPPRFLYDDSCLTTIRSKLLLYLAGRLLRQDSLLGLITIVPDFYKKIFPIKDIPSRKLHLAPDFVNFNEGFHDYKIRSFDWPKNSKLLLVYGALSFRKGISEITTAIKSEMWPQSWHVVFAGVPSSDAREVLGSCCNLENATLALSFQDSSNEAFLFNEATAVWAYYPYHNGSSGVVNLAAAYGKPVIASGNHLKSTSYSQGKDGVLLEDGSVEAIIEALSKVEEMNVLESTKLEARSCRKIHQDILKGLVE